MRLWSKLLERFAQYLDELEDVVYALLTIGERVRRALQILLVLSASLVLQVLGMMGQPAKRGGKYPTIDARRQVVALCRR